ncbi:MAG: Gfo/Idh/MocA family oxidoreductase [Candidatus Pacebacteria bacterium]|nr:Gfo/Idh/MocA family oxidoreductase [Candidatus Paceibacterota bacterium]
MNKNNWAIVGLGHQAETIAKAIKNSKMGVLSAVAGDNSRHTENFARNHNVAKHSDSLNKLLSADKKNDFINSVFISSPNYRHAGHALLSISAGKNVLCEKPLVLKSADALKIGQAAKKNGRLFGVGFQLRFHPALLEAKKIINSKILGKVRLAEIHWSTGRAGEIKFPPLPKHMLWRENLKLSGGGALMSRGIHLLDLLDFLFSGKAMELTAVKDEKNNVPDKLTVGIIRLPGMLVQVTTGRQIPFAENRLVIYGSNGRLILKDAFTPNGTGTLELKTPKKQIVKKFSKKIDLYQKEVENFNQTVLKKGKWTGADINSAIKSVILAEKWNKSIRTGKTVKI